MLRFILLLIFTGTAVAGPLLNGDFESALGVEWTVKNQVAGTPGATITRSNGARTGGTGQWVLDVATRDHVQDGPMQGSFSTNTLRDALRVAGSGRTYTTRLWVKLAAPHTEASVRCLLNYRVSSAPQIPLILAEAIITQSDTWVEVTGTATLTWTGVATALTSATLDFEVEQLHSGNTSPPPASWFPSFSVDDEQMELDADGDGLWDSEESFNHAQTSLSFADAVDSDGDRMSDDWERVHHLKPRDASDADVDADGDGFSNVQEYFAATDPESSASFPGLASDPQATLLARAFLRYFALRPWRQQRLVGQHVTDNTVDFNSYWTPLGLAQNGGRFPAILSLAIEGMASPLQIVGSINHAINHAQSGGVPLIKWAMWNPWRAHLAGSGQTGLSGDLNAIDIPGLLNPALASPINTPPQTPPVGVSASNVIARSIFDGWIDSVAAEIVRYNAATGGAPLLFRPLSEMNGNWFWWGHRPRVEYLGLWNHIRDRLTQPAPNGHGLHNLIWTYESASSEHVHPVPGGTAAASDYYYPGDDRVDVFGHNLYDDDWVLRFDANKLYARHPKIYGVPQAGASNVAAVAHTFDNQTYLTQIAARYPRMSFFIPWNGFTSHDDDDNNPLTASSNDDADPSTPDTPTHKHLALVENPNVNSVLTAAAVITRDELAWRPPLAFTAAPQSSTQVALGWTPPIDGDNGIRIEQSANGTTGWSIVTTTASGASAQTLGNLAPATTGWFCARALHGVDDSLATDPLSAKTWTLLQQWKSDWFGDISASSTDDADRDGACNLLEYGLGTDPLAPSNAHLPVAGHFALGAQTYLTLTFRRLLGSPGVVYVVQCSGDLGSWTNDAIPLGAPISNGDGTETVTYRDTVPIGGLTQRFIRLQLMAP